MTDRTEVYQFEKEICEAKYVKRIPFKFGDLEEVLEVGIVNTDIPLLFSEKWLDHEANTDFKEKILYLKKYNIEIRMIKTKGGHLGIKLDKMAEDKEELVKQVMMIKDNNIIKARA